MSSSSTYVITGAARGIGLAFVKQIAAKGHTVFALVRDPEVSGDLKALVDNKKVFAIKVDSLSSVESVKEAAKEVEKLAPEGIDVLINNAGVAGTFELTPENAPKEEFMDVFETNVAGVSTVTQAFLPLLRKRGPEKVKQVFNISSLLASISVVGTVNPTSNFTAYTVSKAALNMLTKLNANAIGSKENICFTVVHPGHVRTRLGGEHAPMIPDESAAAMSKVLDTLTMEHNGSFFDHDGKAITW